MEIGGYIEFEKYNRPMLHEDAIKLNCGRNALAYIIEARGIKKIAMPKFMCDSCDRVLKEYALSVRYYSVGMDFKPVVQELGTDEWLYVVNFYGQLSNDYLAELKHKFGRIIVDNAQGYFQMPIEATDTLYTCRKFFGVADGAMLYSDVKLNREPEQDESYSRMNFLLGRFERTAGEFYGEYVANNHIFSEEPVKKMSKLTENLLRGIDYEEVKNRRTANFSRLHDALGKYNGLKLTVPEGAFMYPFYHKNGAEIRKKLQAMKIFIPTLWPAVFNLCDENDLECDMARNILPLPVDQRYGAEEMDCLISNIKDML